ncbi:MAG TPA: tryptophan--tRNA ligase [Planctomycetota bacterium]|nr:tryptophan--tRNA ligase [Planctomycetota bacterium]
MRERVFSGIQPTGSLHLGNYLGAIRNYVELQDRHEAIYCVVDAHALTSRPDPALLRTQTREAARTLLACGLDPKRCTLFVQSRVPAHAELAWILSSVTAYGELMRMTQFKDKAEQAESAGDLVNAGIFTYPVLMAADILLYKASIVPVGEDQTQHLELAREIARRFNARYGETFPEPRALLSPAKRILGLDGVHKMSKSRGNEIGLLDPPELVRKKLAPAKTDEKRKRRQDPGEPNDCNIYSLHRQVTPPEKWPYIENGCRTASIGCLDCKGILAESIEVFAKPIRERAAALDADPGSVDRVLEEGAKRARAIADATLAEVQQKVGLR